MTVSAVAKCLYSLMSHHPIFERLGGHPLYTWQPAPVQKSRNHVRQCNVEGGRGCVLRLWRSSGYTLVNSGGNRL
ncbi:hypothetical protein M378DRAFT_875427 [Amanita muscaria Koide BX008]|uniref:Uncharacterized protein n=1 Tax=Amanita muscaria (strain Koide BX008) TaxID=946122 RepID=A0A0C2WW43_AMAMK|nr:hypothetical protein M378DRAFT_875427 [Amanita muscaria Koide BX008]